jgi:3-oxoacyl-[acyl-carrier protein] reductase
VLVNNAGVAQQKLFTDLSVDEWQRMMAIHVDGAFYTCRAVLPDMIRAHSGSIVNISSMWGQTGGSCEVHYSTAKAALIGLTKALAKEVGPAGIRVNCVAPGVIRTDMLAELSRETLNDLEEETPLCRLGTPEDVASAVSFLVSDGAGFITGQVLAPNGGIVI